MATPGPGQWNLLMPAGGINVENAWQETYGLNTVVAAVLDTGVLSNASLAPNLLPGVHFINGGSFGTGAAPSCNDCTFNGEFWHGTHVAGIIASTGSGSYGTTLYGVAPGSRVLPVNVFSRKTDADCANAGEVPADWQGRVCLRAEAGDILNALSWLNGDSGFAGLPAPQSGLVAVNMSLGGAGTCGLQNRINNLLTKNIAVVVAAGNDNVDASTVAPANCSGVITVAAVDNDGLRASYSNYGSAIEVAAPGGDADGLILSTVENAYVGMMGTSMATPHVTGLVNLLRSVDPSLTLTQLRDYLYADSQYLTAFPNTTDADIDCVGTKTCGAGIINASLAMQGVMDNAGVIAPHFVRTMRALLDANSAWLLYDLEGSDESLQQYKVTPFMIEGVNVQPHVTEINKALHYFEITPIRTLDSVPGIQITVSHNGNLATSNAITVPIGILH